MLSCDRISCPSLPRASDTVVWGTSHVPMSLNTVLLCYHIKTACLFPSSLFPITTIKCLLSSTGWSDGEPDGSAGDASGPRGFGRAEQDHRRCPLQLPVSERWCFLSKAVPLKHTLRAASEIILHVINARREKHKNEENEKHPETETTRGRKKAHIIQ